LPVFLNFDHQHRLVESALQALVVARELCDMQRIGAIGIGLGSALLRRQRGQIGRLALASPCAQGRRVHAFATHQRADLAGLGAAVGRLHDAALFAAGELPATRTWNDLRIGHMRLCWRRRFGRISSRPSGSLQCARIGRTVHCVHRCLGLLVDRHTYLVAH
jgi:hypothetical protein